MSDEILCDKCKRVIRPGAGSVAVRTYDGVWHEHAPACLEASHEQRSVRRLQPGDEMYVKVRVKTVGPRDEVSVFLPAHVRGVVVREQDLIPDECVAVNPKRPYER
jgi:hypothetical protein